MTKRDVGAGGGRILRPSRRIRPRFISTLLLGAVGIVAAYGGWGAWLQRRVDVRLAALHAAGEPVYPADFDVPMPPAGENGADDFIRAGAILEESEAMRAYYMMTRYYYVSLPLTDAEAGVIDRAVSENAEALALIGSGLGKARVRWPGNVADLPEHRADQWLSNVRIDATMMRLNVFRAHHENRHGDVISQLRRIVDFADRVDRQPEIIPHLVAGGIVAMVASMAEDMSYDLRVGGAGGVDAAAVRGLIVTLLDDRPARAGLVRALQNERKDHYPRMQDFCDHALDGPGRPVSRFFVRPFASVSADLAVRMDTAWIEAFGRSSDLPTARASADVAAMSDEIRGSKMDITASSYTSSRGRSVETEYLRATNCRLAAVALAMRLYAVDHAGRRPQTLAELVPAYLPAVPRDPMAAGGPPLRYQASGGRAIVYSVGVDGVDDGGSEKLRPGVRRDDPNELVDRWQAVDAVLRLERPARYFPPARD